MHAMNNTMQQAMRLMRGGDLSVATRVLQSRLEGNISADESLRHVPDAARGCNASPTAGVANCIDGEFRVVAHDDTDSFAQRSDADEIDSPCRREHFSSTVGDLDYLLYIPAGLEGSRAPLLLMLHGCTQSPEDFALGTRMNLLARAHGYVVAYPQQSAKRNPNLCWNWFRDSDQRRGHGEPAMLAALTRHLVTQHGLDERRVYVAGLSAGGAMAAVLANAYPDVYAAIGVHSGLPIGLASDMPSAFAAMRTGQARGIHRVVECAARKAPAIVFHGDADSTVAARNGAGVIAQSLGAIDDRDAARSTTTIEHGTAEGGRRYTRTLHREDGRVHAEHWLIHGAVHAWSGGAAGGSYTDPTGPDASAQMLRFFTECARARR